MPHKDLQVLIDDLIIALKGLQQLEIDFAKVQRLLSSLQNMSATRSILIPKEVQTYYLTRKKDLTGRIPPPYYPTFPKGVPKDYSAIQNFLRAFEALRQEIESPRSNLVCKV